MTPVKPKSLMVWIDMEMSGLDPEKEHILEIATIITNWDLEIIEEGPDLVVHQPNRVLKGMDDWNQKQHKKSGLIEEVRKSKMSVKRAEKLTLEFIRNHCVAKQSLLCGSAVHHDRRFLIKYMPKVSEFLHYRHVDVSSIKALVSNWYPKNKELPKKTENHRALSDIRESIDELRYYRKTYFIEKWEPTALHSHAHSRS